MRGGSGDPPLTPHSARTRDDRDRALVGNEVFVRKRVVVRSRLLTERDRIGAELRKERIQLELDDAAPGRTTDNERKQEER